MIKDSHKILANTSNGENVTLCDHTLVVSKAVAHVEFYFLEEVSTFNSFEHLPLQM